MLSKVQDIWHACIYIYNNMYVMFSLRVLNFIETLEKELGLWKKEEKENRDMLVHVSIGTN